MRPNEIHDLLVQETIEEESKERDLLNSEDIDTYKKYVIDEEEQE